MLQVFVICLYSCSTKQKYNLIRHYGKKSLFSTHVTAISIIQLFNGFLSIDHLETLISFHMIQNIHYTIFTTKNVLYWNLLRNYNTLLCIHHRHHYLLQLSLLLIWIKSSPVSTPNLILIQKQYNTGSTTIFLSWFKNVFVNDFL